MQLADPDVLHRALDARDARFDGAFFVGISTTGIYCRPICPARIARRDRRAFFPTAALAEKAGFRACFRCRPELAPGRAPVDAVPRLAARAVQRIGEGALNEHSLEELAAELSVSSRQLRRAVEAQVGVSPVELAQSQRLALAKQLLQDTTLPLTEVALAAGFGSLRRFNALFAERFGRAPSAVRREGAQSGAGPALRLRLDFREPYDWDALLAFLAPRCVQGVEEVRGGVWRRAVSIGDRAGVVCVTKEGRSLRADVPLALAPHLMRLTTRLRAVFDLDAEPRAIADALGADPLLRPLVRRRPGLRVPGVLDAFEATVRAVLGQQVSVKGATTLAGRLAARFGVALGAPTRAALGAPTRAELESPTRATPATRAPADDLRAFPTAERLAQCTVDELAGIGVPKARAASLQAVARAFARGVAGVDDLRGLPGLGPWTLEYAAMRGFRAPDAFPASDLGVRKALGGLDARAATARAEPWRPFRAYAVLHLWTSLSEGAA